MNKVICIKGHFYDGDKYDACPHCAAGVAAAPQSAFAVKYGDATGERKSERIGGKKEEGNPKKEKKSLFGRKSPQATRQEAVKAESDETLLLHEAEASQPVVRQASASQRPPVLSSVRGSAAPDPSIFNQAVVSQQIVSRQSVVQPSVSPFRPMQPAEDQSLGAAFAAAAQKAEEKDEGKTVGYFSTGAHLDPPVGYLICIAGEDFGMGFPLKSGSNSMGRSASMDVVIMDEKVSREKQAFVIYEPLKREFYLKPGEGSALCYLNGNVVLEVLKLKQHDIIMLGSTKLMLVPVCGEAFSWDDMKDESMRK